VRITEYAGSEGVISSTWDHARASKPRPGDHLRWNDGSLGRIEQVGDVFGKPNSIHVCRDQGSAFIGVIIPDEHKHLSERAALHFARAYLSISGGPFSVLPIADLKVTYDLAPSTVWNWGDNLAGADMGVQYTFYRPVFAIDRDRPRS
jgi:hypothetical protein